LPSVHRAIHLAEIRRLGQVPHERMSAVLDLAHESVEESSSPQGAMDALNAAMFVRSVHDDGPDIDTQPSKLWTSRQEFQSDILSTTVEDVHTPDIGQLVDAVQRISLGKSDNIEQLVDAVGQMSLIGNSSDSSDVPKSPSCVEPQDGLSTASSPRIIVPQSKYVLQQYCFLKYLERHLKD
jgi:hypothetical protein